MATAEGGDANGLETARATRHEQPARRDLVDAYPDPDRSAATGASELGTRTDAVSRLKATPSRSSSTKPLIGPSIGKCRRRHALCALGILPTEQRRATCTTHVPTTSAHDIGPRSAGRPASASSQASSSLIGPAATGAQHTGAVVSMTGSALGMEPLCTSH